MKQTGKGVLPISISSFSFVLKLFSKILQRQFLIIIRLFNCYPPCDLMFPDGNTHVVAIQFGDTLDLSVYKTCHKYISISNIKENL